MRLEFYVYRKDWHPFVLLVQNFRQVPVQSIGFQDLNLSIRVVFWTSVPKLPPSVRYTALENPKHP